MTKEEAKTKITKIMDEAIKIDNIDTIIKDMKRTLGRKDLTETERDALMIGYAELLNRVHADLKYIWLHLYDFRKDVETDTEEDTDETV